MRSATYLSVLLLFSITTAFGQQEISYDSTTDVHRFTFRGQQYDYRTDNQNNSYRTVGIKGSPFLFADWQSGTLPTHKGNALRFPLNYNMVEDYVVVSVDSVEKIIYPESFRIGDRLFVRLKNQYYEALYSGISTKLLRRYNARLDKVERNGYNENVSYDYEYFKSEDLFLQEPEGSIISVKLNERNLLSKLPDAKIASEIIKNHNLNLRSEQDVVALLTKLEM
ncbi:hypothetical protein [Persicitalea jodogahamensis]|uniref:Uncharacterized protein n=1 Tax=Persicitalea jodogahamensis TaxID=402147 RepID=A0A8J3D6F6_9BACT|nr:hypothetical protein [Persicitalea jodogahamensis]GHB80746.1 hypothetical protein GCM10007390_39060 [Persicitalea jodogahamensis]